MSDLGDANFERLLGDVPTNDFMTARQIWTRHGLWEIATIKHALRRAEREGRLTSRLQSWYRGQVRAYRRVSA